MDEEWVKSILSIFKDNISGRLLIRASIRFMLFKRWSWILKSHFTPEIEEVLNMRLVSSCGPELIANWFGNLQRTLVSLQRKKSNFNEMI
jgi:hypothetical protein